MVYVLKGYYDGQQKTKTFIEFFTLSCNFFF